MAAMLIHAVLLKPSMFRYTARWNRIFHKKWVLICSLFFFFFEINPFVVDILFYLFFENSEEENWNWNWNFYETALFHLVLFWINIELQSLGFADGAQHAIVCQWAYAATFLFAIKNAMKTGQTQLTNLPFFHPLFTLCNIFLQEIHALIYPCANNPADWLAIY